MRHADITIQVDQDLVLAASFADVNGNAFSDTAEGAPVWEANNAAFDYTVSADGLECTLVPKGPLGTFVVNVSTKGLINTSHVTVVAGYIVDINVDASIVETTRSADALAANVAAQVYESAGNRPT